MGVRGIFFAMGTSFILWSEELASVEMFKHKTATSLMVSNTFRIFNLILVSLDELKNVRETIFILKNQELVDAQNLTFQRERSSFPCLEFGTPTYMSIIEMSRRSSEQKASVGKPDVLGLKIQLF